MVARRDKERDDAKRLTKALKALVRKSANAPWNKDEKNKDERDKSPLKKRKEGPWVDKQLWKRGDK